MMNVNERPADQELELRSETPDESEVKGASQPAPLREAVTEGLHSPLPNSANIGHNG